MGGRDLPEKRPASEKPVWMYSRPMAADVIAKAADGERLGDHLGAALQAAPGLEQRRDLDLALDPEQLGEVQRGQS